MPVLLARLGNLTGLIYIALQYSSQMYPGQPRLWA